MTPKRITRADKWCQCEYSTRNPFSVLNKWLLLQDGRGFYSLHTGAGDFDRLTSIGHNSECCWDSTDPDDFYFLSGHTIFCYDAMTHERRPVHIFSEYVPFDSVERNGVQSLGEGDIENNKWALAGMRADGKRDVFMFDLATGRKSNVLTLEPDDTPLTFNKSGRAHGLDNLYCTPSGNVQIGWYASGKDRFQGVELYDGDMNFIRQLASVMSHNDVASYQGRDVLLWGSSADAAINANAIWSIDNPTRAMRMLLNLEWGYAFHASACAQDFCIISTYAPDNSLPSQLLKVRLDGSGSEVLCETGSVMMQNEARGMAYNPTPRASVSRDGSRIVFNSNGGALDRGPNYCDVFMLTLETAEIPRIPTEIPTVRPTEPPIVVTPSPELHMELDSLRKDNAILRQRLAAHQSLEQNLAAAQEAARVATAQVTGLRQEVEVSAAYRQDLEQKNTALEKQIGIFKAALADPHPDPDIWPAIDFLQRGHLPGQRWEFELQETGKLKMFDVIGDERIPIEIPQGNQYLFVETGGLEQHERRTNLK